MTEVGSMAQVVRSLPSKCQVPEFKPQYCKKKKKPTKNVMQVYRLHCQFWVVLGFELRVLCLLGYRGAHDC
jgi:hypothetical protein